MNYSENYGFKLPEAAADNVNVNDLNDNFEKIDENVINVPQVVTGAYTGDGQTPRWLKFSKPILFAYISGNNKTALSINDLFIGGSSASNVAIVVEGNEGSVATVKRQSNGIGLSETSIQIGSQMNVSNAKYAYMVILKGDV